MDQLPTLMKLQGKKLLWTGFNPETGGYVLIFEDKTAFEVAPEITMIADVDQYIEATLADDGVMARQILQLETLFKPTELAPEATDAAVPSEYIAAEIVGEVGADHTINATHAAAAAPKVEQENVLIIPEATVKMMTGEEDIQL